MQAIGLVSSAFATQDANDADDLPLDYAAFVMYMIFPRPLPLPASLRLPPPSCFPSSRAIIIHSGTARRRHASFKKQGVDTNTSMTFN